MAADSRVFFSTVDVTESEWYDYDEKESREVSITEMQFKLVLSK